MDKSQDRASLLIVGPTPSVNTKGGVSRHMQYLSRLEVLRKAAFTDPGSTDGKISLGLIGAFWGAIGVWRVARAIGVKQVWINTSIYPLAFLKLLLLLMGMRFAPGCTVRVFFHGGRFEKIRYLKVPTIRWLSQVLLQNVSSFHILSREQATGFARVFPGFQWRRFSNFVPDSNLLVKSRCERKVFLFVGRLVKEKGIREIVMAVENLQKYGICLSDMAFWFAGDGPELPLLRNAAISFPKGVIRILGHLSSPELDSIYQSAYALLLPSYAEGFPYVVIEAMRAGLPIICSPTGALGDLIRSGENGFVVDPGDVAGLADAIEILAGNESLAARFGQKNAQLFLEMLSKTAAQEFYDRLLHEL